MATVLPETVGSQSAQAVNRTKEIFLEMARGNTNAEDWILITDLRV